MKKHLTILLLVIVIGLFGCSKEASLEGLEAPTDGETIARGGELVKGLASCGFCHGETPEPSARLSGGREFFDLYGGVYAPNITPSSTGLKDWEPLDVMRAIRGAIGRDGRMLSSEAHRGFEWLSNRDALAIVSYLRAIPPIDREVERRDVGFLSRNTKGFLESRSDEINYVPDIDKRHMVQYGGYLVDHVARCIQCHNGPTKLFGGEEYLAGGREFKTADGEKIVPGIGPSQTEGIGTWTEDAVLTYLKTGKTPAGDHTDPHFCPTGFYSNGAESDLQAMAKFLKSLK